MGFTAVLGIVFVGLAFASTYLMFQFWGYAYDKEAKQSACPQWKHDIHRAVGYAYAAIYVVMMWHMVPRLWQYHIEFPPRTVAHIMLGLTIGVILLIKISILRWFRHFEEWMPALGFALLLCSVLLVALSLPASLKASGGVGHDAFAADNRARTRTLLAGAGFAPGIDLDALSQERALRHGRDVLLEKCSFCHDLQTAIARPRTPEDWRRTVERMADKPTLGPVLDDRDIQQVTAYLVAITPDLQQSVRAKRVEDEARRATMQAMEAIGDEPEPEVAAGDAGPVADVVPPTSTAPPTAAPSERPAATRAPKRPPTVDLVAAKAAYQRVCSKCHPTSDTDESPPRSRRAVDALMARMIDNGLEAEAADLRMVRAYLVATYAR
jgi:mono/diheme cytochrome c family protein